MDADRRPRRREGIVTRQVVGETVLVPVQRRLGDQHCIYTLTEVGAWLWERLDGRRTVAELVLDLTTEFDAGADRARADVTAFLEALSAEQLVDLEAPPAAGEAT